MTGLLNPKSSKIGHFSFLHDSRGIPRPDGIFHPGQRFHFFSIKSVFFGRDLKLPY